MCATCGCSSDGGVRLIDLRPHRHADGTTHAHGQGHLPTQPDSSADTETLTLEARVLAKNDDLAAHNRSWLAARRTVAINLMSSPGSGKTTLLEHSIRALDSCISVGVIEGDQETTFDGERILATGASVVQVNTGAGCHLDAAMVRTALQALDPDAGLVLIENVGNLVCPAMFDLGEAARVVIMSVTEGADKPLKYPHIFRQASIVVLNKVDLLPYVDFDVERFTNDVGRLNPTAAIVPVSATRGDGMATWLAWLTSFVAVGALDRPTQ